LSKKIIVVCLLVIVIFSGSKFYGIFQKINQLEKEIEDLNNQISKEKEENTQLTKQLKNINDLKYVEKMARKKLGLVKEGEILVVPVKDDN
jgi:cell division protein FtsB